MERVRNTSTLLNIQVSEPSRALERCLCETRSFIPRPRNSIGSDWKRLVISSSAARLHTWIISSTMANAMWNISSCAKCLQQEHSSWGERPQPPVAKFQPGQRVQSAHIVPADTPTIIVSISTMTSGSQVRLVNSTRPSTWREQEASNLKKKLNIG